MLGEAPQTCLDTKSASIIGVTAIFAVCMLLVCGIQLFIVGCILSYRLGVLALLLGNWSREWVRKLYTKWVEDNTPYILTGSVLDIYPDEPLVYIDDEDIEVLQDKTFEPGETELLVEPEQYDTVHDHDTFLDYNCIMSATSRQLKQWAKEQKLKGYGSATKSSLQLALIG